MEVNREELERMAAEPLQDVDEQFMNRLQELLDKSGEVKELRPDQILLDKVVELIEERIGDVELLFEMARSGPFESSKGMIELYPIKKDFQVIDVHSKQGVDAMWDNCFKPAAEYLAQQIVDGGFNVCCPSMIENPNMTAETGALQVFRWGQKVSVYMKHNYNASNRQTSVNLILLLGNL